MDFTTTQVIAGLSEVWESLFTATDGCTVEQWATPTSCPGWDVQDQLSHLVGIERALQGATTPEIVLGEREYIKNPIGANNEQWVESLRSQSGDAVRREFADVTAERIAELKSLTDEQFDAIGWSPIGQVPMRKFMEIRIMDSWLHEQDVRAALGRPGGRNGVGEAVALERANEALGVVVGKIAQAPEGSSVAFEITGPLGYRRRIEVQNGRAQLVDSGEATATITLSQETFVQRFGGRITADEALGREGTFLAGDRALCEAVVNGLGVMI